MIDLFESNGLIPKHNLKQNVKIQCCHIKIIFINLTNFHNYNKIFDYLPKKYFSTFFVLKLN